jgi:hypothetical protein
MTSTLREQYLIRRGALMTERATWLPHYRELSQHITPRTGRFLTTDRNKGAKRHNNIIDSTATRASRVLAAGLMAGMTSPARPWFRLATSDNDLMQYAPVKAWLSAVTEKMQQVFAQSNTYRSLHTIYEELGVYGTAASVILDDFDDVIRHYPATCGEYMIATNHRGEVDTLYREFDMTVAAIVGQFGIDNVSQSTKAMYDRGTLDAWVTVMHVIEPRSARDTSSKLSRDKPFASCYMEIASNLGHNQGFLRESGFDSFPAVCPRWHASGGDIYGDSPGMEALGDVKQLQHGQLRKAQGIDYQIKPPLQIPTSLKNMPLSTLPGGVAYVDQSTSGNAIKTMFDVRLDLNGQLEDIRDVRSRINQTYYVDLFLMLAQADTRQPVTAREVAEKHEEKLLMLGPVLERLHNELLKRKIDVTFERMLVAGIIPPPPEEMHKQALNVDFVSMLAQAQRAIGVGSVDRLVQTIGTIATFQQNSGQAPTAMDKLKVDDIIDAYSDMLGVDPDLVVANDQVALIRADRAKQQAAAQQAAALPAAAQTARELGDTNVENLRDVVSQFSGYSGPGLPVAAEERICNSFR